MGAMRPYVIRQGDYLTKLAFEMGFDAEEVWNDAKNSALKARRGQRDVLYPGDILYVPEDGRKRHSVKLESQNDFTAEIPKVKVKLAFQDSKGEKRAGVACTIHGMGAALEKPTDGDGKLELDVPVSVRLLTVIFADDPVAYHMRIGHADPVEEPSGVRQRLAHLGFFHPRPGEEPPAEAARLEDALKRFQKTQGLGVTGQADEPTRDKLRTLHGS